jgi:hypothetical protein
MDGRPTTHYVKSDDVHVAYQVFGEGSLDLLFVPGFVSNIEAIWGSADQRAFFQRLASFSRVILFDKRGTGMSDRSSQTLEQRMHDVQAILDEVGSKRAAIAASSVACSRPHTCRLVPNGATVSTPGRLLSSSACLLRIEIAAPGLADALYGRAHSGREAHRACGCRPQSDDRRFFVPVLVLFVLFVLVFIVVGVSRRRRAVPDGDEAPFNQPVESVLGGAWGHVGSCLDVATFTDG